MPETPLEEHNMIEEIKRLLLIIYRGNPYNHGDNRSLKYFKNVDINKLIKNYSKYRTPRTLLPMEGAY